MISNNWKAAESLDSTLVFKTEELSYQVASEVLINPHIADKVILQNVNRCADVQVK